MTDTTDQKILGGPRCIRCEKPIEQCGCKQDPVELAQKWRNVCLTTHKSKQWIATSELAALIDLIDGLNARLDWLEPAHLAVAKDLDAARAELERLQARYHTDVDGAISARLDAEKEIVRLRGALAIAKDCRRRMREWAEQSKPGASTAPFLKAEREMWDAIETALGEEG